MRRPSRRDVLALAALYAVFAVAVVSSLEMMPSATYRDEWGFAEFRTASSILAGVFPVPTPETNLGAYHKVLDISCSVATGAIAAGIARATGLPLETVYAHGWWGALLAPFAAFLLLRQVATPLWSALGSGTATLFSVGFPYYLVDPKGILLFSHALFLLAAWRLVVAPSRKAAILAAAAVLLTAAVYMPFGVVEAIMLALILAFTRTPARIAAAGGGVLAAAALLAPGCYTPYAERILDDLHAPQYPPPYVPYLQTHGMSFQLVAALIAAIIASFVALARPLQLASQRFLWAAGIASLGFLVSNFSIHRAFTFVALPLALVLAETASGRGSRRAPSAPRDQLASSSLPVLGLALPTVAPGTMKGFRRTGERLWTRGLLGAERLAPATVTGQGRVMLLLFLVASILSLAAHPSTPIARSGLFSPEYLEGVRHVAASVDDVFISDVKFAGAVYAHTGRTNGYHILDNYDEEGEITRMWYSDNVAESIAVMQAHCASVLVLTSDMWRTFVVGDFFRAGVGPKLEQVEAAREFHLLYDNGEVQVYELTRAEESAWINSHRDSRMDSGGVPCG